MSEKSCGIAFLIFVANLWSRCAGYRRGPSGGAPVCLSSTEICVERAPHTAGGAPSGRGARFLLFEVSSTLDQRHRRCPSVELTPICGLTGKFQHVPSTRAVSWKCGPEIKIFLILCWKVLDASLQTHPNVGLMLGHRLRCLPIIKQASGRCPKLSTLENLENEFQIFQSGKSQGIWENSFKSGKCQGVLLC